jgi:regulator of telomere elongation helicase 1
VPVGPFGHPLNSSYRTRETEKYKQELGTVIGKVFLQYAVFLNYLLYVFDVCACFAVNFARMVPDGLLVFFPSYSMMDKCIDFWKNRICIIAMSYSQPFVVDVLLQ